MKVKINKKAETQEFEVVNNWSDVSLEKWLKFYRKNNDRAGLDAITQLKELSNIPLDLVKELSIRDVATIMEHFERLQNEAEVRLSNIIEVEGIEYGFHPKLDDITLGEYADIETLIVNGLENNLPELMAILYRPIVEKKNDKYTIEAYDGDITIRAEKFKRMSAQAVQNAMVFFWTFANELLTILPSYLMERIRKMSQVKDFRTKDSQKNGGGSE